MAQVIKHVQWYLFFISIIYLEENQIQWIALTNVTHGLLQTSYVLFILKKLLYVEISCDCACAHTQVSASVGSSKQRYKVRKRVESEEAHVGSSKSRWP